MNAVQDDVVKLVDKELESANKRLEEYKSQITLFDLGLERNL